ncbi:MAG: peptidase M3, partial [Micrococcales bacterium]|nr:peptidase M3 [Micrococcales bacterium]
MTANPVASAPSPLTLPAKDWLGWLGSRGDEQLATARGRAEALKAAPPTEALGALQVWNDVHVGLANAAAVGSLLAEVHPDPVVRERAEEIVQAAQKLDTDLGLDPGLYAVFERLDGSDLDPDAARVLERTLRDFRRAGVDRDVATRDRLRELSERSVLLSQEFSKNIREDVRSIAVRPDQLAGLPADWVASHPAGEGGLVTVTSDYPDAIPFRTFAEDAEARRDLTRVCLNVGWPSNDV